MLKKITMSAKNLTTTKGIVLSAMLLAVFAVLGTFKIPIPPAMFQNRLTLTFAATSAAGMILGPVPAAIIGALGDVLGYLMNQGGGVYFPGFTLSAALGGFIYGICLYGNNKKYMIWRIMLAVFIITVFVNMILNTFWLSLMYNKAYVVFAVERIIKNAISYPIHVAIIFAIFILTERTGIRKKYL